MFVYLLCALFESVTTTYVIYFVENWVYYNSAGLLVVKMRKLCKYVRKSVGQYVNK